MEGWVCPKCGAVYSPYVAQCVNCPQAQIMCDSTIPTLCSCGTTAPCLLHQRTSRPRFTPVGKFA